MYNNRITDQNLKVFARRSQLYSLKHKNPKGSQLISAVLPYFNPISFTVVPCTLFTQSEAIPYENTVRSRPALPGIRNQKDV